MGNLFKKISMAGQLQRSGCLFLVLLCAGTLLLGGCGKDSSGSEEITEGSFANASVEAVPAASEEPVQLTEREKKEARLAEENYQDAERKVAVLGLKTYKKLKVGDYTDRPKKGKVYLVLFLMIWNSGIEDTYFNPYQLSASVDGKPTENTALVNRPEGYPTVFTTIPAGQKISGFVAWEVPKDWEKLEVAYDGFASEDKKVSIEMNFSNKDTMRPDYYSEPR